MHPEIDVYKRQAYQWERYDQASHPSGFYCIPKLYFYLYPPDPQQYA